MESGSGVIGVEAMGSVGTWEVLPASSAERPATEAVIAVSSAALAADRQRLQDAEQRRIDRDRQLELSRERELARFD